MSTNTTPPRASITQQVPSNGQFGSAKDLGAWLDQYRGSAICLFTTNTATKVLGTCLGLEEVDACSTDYQACDIQLSEDDRVSASLSLHGDYVLLQVIYRTPGGEVLCALAERIALAQLRLQTQAEQQATKRQQEQQRQTKLQQAQATKAMPLADNPYTLLSPPAE